MHRDCAHGAGGGSEAQGSERPPARRRVGLALRSLPGPARPCSLSTPVSEATVLSTPTRLPQPPAVRKCVCYCKSVSSGTLKAFFPEEACLQPSPAAAGASKCSRVIYNRLLALLGDWPEAARY